MSEALRIGDKVFHYKFGKGTVQDLIHNSLLDIKFGEKRKYIQRNELRLWDELVREEKVWKSAKAKIQYQLQNNFYSVDEYFRQYYGDFISYERLEKEKIHFVRTWITENNLANNKFQSSQTILDIQQATAIAAIHGNIQVVARAGSGKTTTLTNRALFLQKHCGVAPSEMLLLAFNRKAALEIRRRLLGLLNAEAEIAVSDQINRQRHQTNRSTHENVDIEAQAIETASEKLDIELPHVMTFHALAYAIVHPEESLLYDGREGNSQALSRTVQQIIDQHLRSLSFYNVIRKLMLAHFREDWERIIKGGYDKSKDDFLQLRRSLPGQSLGGEYVKSYGEKIIADFLFEHDIAYRYERNHWWSGINYRPDFTIFKNAERGKESGLIIEYFGLKGDPDYDEMSAAKRDYWARKPRWTLLEFSPQDITSRGKEAFLASLQSRLEANGIPCRRLSEDEIWHRIKDRAIDRFTKAMVGFIGRCRKQLISPEKLLALIQNYTPLSRIEHLFHRLAHHFYVTYLERLAATGEDDFDGLMQRAIDAVNDGQTLFHRKSSNGDLKRLRYVFIDEFQDFSELFYQLLCAIRRQNPQIELFCVGDDWQAINGFAGSDLKYFNNFQRYIGEARRLYVSTNYRSSNEIVDVGNALMDGLGKPAVAHKQTAGEVLVSDLNDFRTTLIEQKRHPGDSITPAVLRLVAQALATNQDVVMLCRRNAIPWFVNYQKASRDTLHYFLTHIRSYFPEQLRERITISTAHSYKGLEKPVVIALDVIARSYPLIHPDWVFTRILGDDLDKIIDEERRLLYVALTRAIEKLVIITDGRSKSPFLEELEQIKRLRIINWDDYPPPISATNARFVVKVGNQEHFGVSPTFAIKDLLKAAGYLWQSTGWPSWAKSFPASNFTINILKSELWAGAANGIEVRIVDEAENLKAHYLINNGQWHCIFNHISR